MRWRRHPRVLSRTAPGYLALATVGGDTVEVAGPGGDVWARLVEWTAEEDLTAGLARQYGVAESTISSDVRALLRDLLAQGYVEQDA